MLKGTMSASGQQDWYKVTCPISGRLDVVLGCPSGYDYNVYLYSTNGTTLLSSGSTHTAGYGESCGASVTSGNTYYIKVTNNGTSVSSNAYYYLYPVITGTKTWYSQYNSNVLGKEYWNTYLLDNLYFTGYSSSKCFMKDASTDIMDMGCAITAYAMVLRNLSATTESDIHDFRTGFYGKAIPDPFILTLCNLSITANPTYTNSRYEYSTTMSSSPVTIRSHSTLAGAFGYTSTKSSGTSISTIKTLLSTHSEGVIVQFKTSSDEHWLVFCPSTNSDGYVVYDPGTGTSSKGNGVAFTSSYTYVNKGLTLNDISAIYYLSKKSS